VISSVVVSYRVRPEAVAEHVRLIRAVFEQLHAEQPDNVEYKVVCLADGVSFVHVVVEEDGAGSVSLADVPAFREFQADIADRCDEQPVATGATVVGAHRMLGGK